MFYLEPVPVKWLVPEPVQDRIGSTTLRKNRVMYMNPCYCESLPVCIFCCRIWCSGGGWGLRVEARGCENVVHNHLWPRHHYIHAADITERQTELPEICNYSDLVTCNSCNKDIFDTFFLSKKSRWTRHMRICHHEKFYLLP